MDSDTSDPLDLDGLRQKLRGAERKYYTNLNVLQEKLSRLEAFQTLSKLLVACTDSTEVLTKLAELSIQYMGVEKAIVVQPIERGYGITALKGYSRRQTGEIQTVVISADNGHMQKAAEGKKPILLETVDGELADKLDLKQLILCPLHSVEGIFFGLYIVGISEKKKELFRTFDLSDVEFFDTIGAQVSALLQNLNLRDSFKRFVPFEFLALLEKNSIQDVNASDNVSLNMHVMFTDLRDFTLMSERMGPAAVFALLNEYLGVMEPQIASAGGFINQYQGDAIMALFTGESDGAVHAAVRMWNALGALNQERSKRGEGALRAGIGINSGDLLLGAIGCSKRLDSNVVGDAPNLASRVEGMTKVYGARVLISGSTYAQLTRPGDFTFRELDRVIVAGKTEPVEVYELLDVDPETLRQQKTRTATRFAQGLHCYRAGEFHQARLIFADCLVKAPLDEAAALYIGRCVDLLAHPPAGVWDGITVLSRK